MISHDSIAILTRERARISDQRVPKLADGIIETQGKEIGENENTDRRSQKQALSYRQWRARPVER